MNIVLNIADIDEKSIYFTDAKANTHLPNSTFNRITYSTDNFIMSGIYVYFELYIKNIENNYNNVYNYNYDPTYEHNKQIINAFHQIERGILNKWSRLHSTSHSLSLSDSHSDSKIPVNELTTQMMQGMISVWKHEVVVTDKPAFYTFIVKISGIWENENTNENGLTYKFI
jgi:hypothetical protein